MSSSSFGDRTKRKKRSKRALEQEEGNTDCYLSDLENEAKEGKAREKNQGLHFLVIIINCKNTSQPKSKALTKETVFSLHSTGNPYNYYYLAHVLYL